MSNLELVESGSKLVLYDRMRFAVQECVKIDEAAKLKDQAAALAHYARQRDDQELEIWVSEIKVRAAYRIGEISRELEKNERARTDLRLSSETQTKTGQLKAAGLSKQAANRYEQLAAPVKKAKAVFDQALEDYCASSVEQKKPATVQGLSEAIETAAHKAGIKLKKPPRQMSKVEIDVALKARESEDRLFRIRIFREAIGHLYQGPRSLESAAAELRQDLQLQPPMEPEHVGRQRIEAAISFLQELLKDWQYP